MIPPSYQKRRVGRPLCFGHHFTLYADDEMDAGIRAHAKRSGVTVAEALRELIEFGLESLKETA